MGNLKHVSFTFLFTVFLAGEAWALPQTTAVLPQNTFRARVVTGTSVTFDHRKNNESETERLGSEYNVGLDKNMIIMMNPAAGQLFDFLNQTTEALGAGTPADEINFGALDVASNPSITLVTPALEYGITDWLTVGVQIPVMVVDNEVSGRVVDGTFQDPAQTQAIIAGTLQQLNAKPNKTPQDLQTIGQLTALQQQLQGMSQQQISMTTLQEHLASKGYKPFQNESNTALGDMKVGVKVRALQTAHYTLGVKAGVVIPTGTADDPNSIVDVKTGDGQWDIGFDVIQDVHPTSWLRLSLLLGYTAQLPDSERTRVPENGLDILPATVERLNRDKGDKTRVEFGPTFEIANTGVSLGGAYFFHYQMADNWETGSSALAYDLLDDDTESILHSFDVSVKYSTIGLYKKKQFPVPGDVILTYTHPFAGKNANLASLFLTQMRVYF